MLIQATKNRISSAILTRIHAYHVTPQRMESEPQAAVGGLVQPPEDFLESLDVYRRDARLERQPMIGFQPRWQSGSEFNDNPVRNLIRVYTFGPDHQADDVGQQLADRLGQAMDSRSNSCLLVLSVYERSDARLFVGWAFPHDDPYGFQPGASPTSIHLIENAYSRSSSFRKAVLFQGNEDPDQFWQGHVMDRQSRMADYWVQDFLDCQLLLDGPRGTRLLADLLRQTHQELDDRQDQDQVARAVLATQAVQRKSWSLARFAREYLSGSARTAFLKKVPEPVLTTEFELDKGEFQARAGWRTYQLEQDVTVVAPLETDRALLRISAGQRRYLKCEGWVVAESVTRYRRTRSRV